MLLERRSNSWLELGLKNSIVRMNVWVWLNQAILIFFTVLVLQTIFSKQNFAILSNYKLTAAAECTVVSFCTNEETHRGV